MGRAEVQPWEEGQRIYRQHLERIDLWWVIVTVGEKSQQQKLNCCWPCEARVTWREEALLL